MEGERKEREKRKKKGSQGRKEKWKHGREKNMRKTIQPTQ
jgi:hypothetical protein